MPRKKSQKPSWPRRELHGLFGADGDTYDAGVWREWLRTNRREAADALNQLVDAGLDREMTTEILMRLHNSMRWHMVPNDDVRDAEQLADALRRHIQRFAKSDLREYLYLGGADKFSELEQDLFLLASRLDKAATAGFANRRESFARNYWLARLMRRKMGDGHIPGRRHHPGGRDAVR